MLNPENSLVHPSLRNRGITVRFNTTDMFPDIRPMKYWITPDPLSDDGKLELGKDITLTCNTDAQPVDELRYFWYKEVRSMERINQLSQQVLTLGMSMVLTLHYICRNQMGDVRSMQIMSYQRNFRIPSKEDL